MISGYPKHIFFPNIFSPWPPPKLSTEVKFQVALNVCLETNWYDHSSETFENINNFQQWSNQSKIWIFWHVLDVFLELSNRIKPIPFHERSLSQDICLEDQQQGNWSNLKIHIFRPIGVFFGGLGEVKEILLVTKNMFWVSRNYRWPNEILAELIWNKKGGMTHERGQGKNVRGKKICFGYPEIIGDQMRHWLN